MFSLLAAEWGGVGIEQQAGGRGAGTKQQAGDHTWYCMLHSQCAHPPIAAPLISPPPPLSSRRVVTGYQNIARKYFAEQGFEHVVLLSADGALHTCVEAASDWCWPCLDVWQRQCLRCCELTWCTRVMRPPPCYRRQPSPSFLCNTRLCRCPGGRTRHGQR
jgi:hypothetical protein